MPIEQPHTRQDVSEGAFLAAIGYFGVLCLIPLFLQPNNKYSRYHAKQGLVLFAAEVVLGVGGVILFVITYFIGEIFNHIPILGGFLGGFLFGFVINKVVLFTFVAAYFLGSFSFSVIGAYNAWGGNLWQMPLLWYYARRLKF